MIQDYTTYLRSVRGYSPRTADGYGKDLRAFAIWAQRNTEGKRWSQITREDIDRYVIEREGEGMKPATTNRALSAISGLYNYMKREGYEVENPCKYESRRKRAKTIPNTIPAEDLRTAYAHAYGATKIMLGLLITTGMRIGELLALQYGDIDFKERAIVLQGKGNKQRRVYATGEALETLQTAAQWNEPTTTIFPIGQRECRRMIFEALKPYSNAKQLSPHAIRHTFATNLATQGENVSTIAGILGHEKLETTQRYIDATQIGARAAIERTSIL